MTRSILGTTRSLAVAATLALVASASDAKAGFQLAFSGLTSTNTATGGTTLDFSLPPVQSVANNAAASFNVLNIGEPAASLNGAGSYTVTETVTITGTTPNPTAGETGTLVSSFMISGQVANFTGFTFTPTSGAGNFTINVPTYGQPGVGSSAVAGSGAVGNLSMQFTPNAVPEPGSLALCGMAGLIGLGIARVRRNRTA